MKIVLDTNCLLISVSSRSQFFWLWQAFLTGKYVICYTTEILNEYAEILSRYVSVDFANNIIDTIINAPNAEPITVYYNWNLIITDPDDNKFVDCAVSANAKYIVTNDRHFNILKEIDFPKVDIATIDEFQEKIP
jgi:putative PIN family toxin of toxin-antitoxin system